MDDRELLERYCRGGEQEAFAELVRRHGVWIYPSARRRLGDDHLAEDAAQGVFLLLARKAGRLSADSNLGAWLFGTLRYCINEARRERSRQRHYEKEAAQMRSEILPAAGWDEISPLLDDAVGKLGKADREVVLLRFYQQKAMAEVGEALGLSEEAAKKRVQRAVGKLREKLAGKGVAVEAGSLGAMVLAHAVEGMEGGAAGLVEKVMAGIGGGVGNGTAGLIAKGAEKMMMMAKVKVVAAIVALVVVAGTVTAGVAQQAKLSPASQPNVTGVAPKPVIQGDVVHVRTNGTDEAGGSLVDDMWFVRGKGIATAGRYSSGAVSCQLDDGVNTWRYRLGGKIIGRSASGKTVDAEVKRIEDRLVKAVPSGLVRDASGDRVVAGVNNRCYKPAEANEEAQISAVWIDDAQRLRAVSTSVAHERDVEISYEDPIPGALFSTAWPQDAQVIDDDAYLPERYSLAKAIFKKEAAGLVFAVHECAVDDRGCYYILCSTRPVSGTEKDLGKIKGYVGGMTRAGDDRESLGYIPEELGRLQNMYGWVQVRWYAFVPDPSVPELHGALRFAATASAANELATWREGKGLAVTEEFVVELDGNLDGKTDAPTSAEDFARTFWTEGERLWPAVGGTLWMTKPSRNGNGILESHRPGTVPQEEYLKNVRKRIDHVMNPQEPSPWQMQ